MREIVGRPVQLNVLGHLPLNAVKTGIRYLIVMGVIAFLLSRAPRDFSMTLGETRPFAQLAAILLAGIALWGVANMLRAFFRHPRQVAWRISWGLVGWIGIAASLAGILLLAPGDGLPISGAVRAIESIVPLVLAVQAGLIFSPEDEPGLEVLLAVPRPAAWLVLERLVMLFMVQGVVVLIGVGVCRLVEPNLDIPLTLVRWVPPAVLLTGIAAFTTLRSRVAMFGATIAGLVWFVFAFFRAGLLPGMPTFWPLNLLLPFIWSFNPYLQPGDVPSADYWLNRFIVKAGRQLTAPPDCCSEPPVPRLQRPPFQHT